MARLIFTGENGIEETLHLDSKRPVIVVGRNPECDLRTRNNTVSRIHARFLWERGVVRVVDQRSANGVWVENERVTEARLGDGQRVFLGAFLVTVRLDPEDLEAREGPTEEGPPPLPEGPVVAPRKRTAAWSEEAAVAGPSTPMKPLGYQAASKSADSADPGRFDEEIIVLSDEASALEPPARSGLDPDVARAHEERGPESSEKRLAEMEMLLEQARQRERRMEAQIEDLTRVLQHQEKELREAAILRERLAGLEQSLHALEADGNRLREELDAANRRLMEAEAQRDRLRQEGDVLRQERDVAVRAAEEAERRWESVESAKAELERRLQDLVRAGQDSEEVESLRQRARSLEEEIGALRERVDATERLRQETLRHQEEIRRNLDVVTEERDRLLEEVERWEGLKRQFEEDRARLEARLETQERDLADLSSALRKANEALVEARRQGAATQVMADEIEELRAANRAALKKVARLMEELERVQSAGRHEERGGLGTRDLEGQVADLQQRLQEVSAERDRLRDLADRLQERIASLEAAVPTGPMASSAPLDEVFRGIVDRINDALSEFRTGLDVLTGLLPEVIGRIPEGAGEEGEQVTAAVEDLGRLVGELKGEVVEARRLLRR